MSPGDHRRILGALAQQLACGEDLTPEQREFLSRAFYRISNGGDANEVFGVKRGRGKKVKDDLARQGLSQILHWVACAISPDPSSDERAMSVEDAIELAVQEIVPSVLANMPEGDKYEYSVEYLMSCWSDPRYKHMRSPARTFWDPDFPYHSPLANDKDSK
jgi:hypothetical protein